MIDRQEHWHVCPDGVLTQAMAKYLHVALSFESFPPSPPAPLLYTQKGY